MKFLSISIAVFIAFNSTVIFAQDNPPSDDPFAELEKEINSFENEGSASDIEELILYVKDEVLRQFDVELKIEVNNDIEQVCVVGSGLPQPIALIVLSEEGRKKSAQDAQTSLTETLESVNSQIDHHESMKKFIVMKEEWTIENGLLTPTMKVKRNDLEKAHAGKYETWYEEDGSILWE